MIRGEPRHAFTLIELLICTTMISILTGGLFSMIAGLHERASNLEEWVDTEEAATNLIRLWRADVERASQISLSNGSMTIQLPGGAGEASLVRYELTAAGGIDRFAEAETPPRRTIARDCEALAFSSVEGAWRIEWTSVVTGARVRRGRVHAAFAAPLLGLSP